MRATGRWLIAAGVAVWGVYGMWWLAGGEPEVVWFLPFHLAGVAPGAILSRWGASGLRRRRT
jgi:hypothetical protein